VSKDKPVEIEHTHSPRAEAIIQSINLQLVRKGQGGFMPPGRQKYDKFGIAYDKKVLEEARNHFLALGLTAEIGYQPSPFYSTRLTSPGENFPGRQYINVTNKRRHVSRITSISPAAKVVINVIDAELPKGPYTLKSPNSLPIRHEAGAYYLAAGHCVLITDDDLKVWPKVSRGKRRLPKLRLKIAF
jgi:hypothetical protein